VIDGACKDVRNGFDPAVRMPRKACQIVSRVITAEVIEKKEWIKITCLAEPERPAEMYAGAFESRLGFCYASYCTDGHRKLLLDLWC
jgi:hypothetical protein